MPKKLLDWGFNGNVWVWFHILAGGIGAKLALFWFNKVEACLVILFLALGWEVIEYFIDGGKAGMIKIYGSLERWVYDCLGDVIGAVIISIVVVV